MGFLDKESGKGFLSPTLKAIMVGGAEKAETEEKTVSITANGTTEVTPDEGKLLERVTAVVNVPTSVIADVSTAEEMNALLTEENIGKAYRFTGVTDANYKNGDVYEVVRG